ncbi:MAG: hypothetical protein CMI52_00630 [Parcubacteria group bacterium]|nr:hypothetical protein [Parcubacteria group bacterium]|tara:strand:+ start:1388 stop:2254 length:867 start_codon:yes stop_codon:yes gene_type:complete
MRIFIIGAGRIGKAIEKLLGDYEPAMWDVDESCLEKSVDCSVEMAHADLIFLCAPTSVHADLAQKIASTAKPDAYVVSIAKGLSEDGQTVPEILHEYLDADRVGVLCGPMMSEEIMKGKPSFSLIASHNARLAKDVQKVFAKSNLTVNPSKDIHGVAWLSVLKNVYATLMGAMEALDLGCNMRGFMMTEIARETRDLLGLLSCDPDTWFSAAGIGDLVCTTSSPFSRNRTYGESLVTGADAKQGEGAIAISFLKERLAGKFSDFKLLVAMDELMSNPKRAKKIFEEMI